MVTTCSSSELQHYKKQYIWFDNKTAIKISVGNKLSFLSPEQITQIVNKNVFTLFLWEINQSFGKPIDKTTAEY